MENHGGSWNSRKEVKKAHAEHIHGCLREATQDFKQVSGLIFI